MIFDELKGSKPFYMEGQGNGCMIIVGDREEWLPRSEKSCLNHLAKHYCVDLRELKRRTRNILGKGKYIPLVLHDDCTLIPFKARRPIFKDDGAYGYFRMESIVEIKEVKGKVIVVLDNAMKVEVLTSAGKLREYIRLAKMLRVSLLRVS